MPTCKRLGLLAKIILPLNYMYLIREQPDEKQQLV
jgi:hypothetical protein